MLEMNTQKMKMPRLWEILRQQSDEDSPLTTRQILQKLEEEGIICDRRTLSRDIALLNQYGFTVADKTIGHEKAYYVKHRAFSVPEIKILIDAVEAANFITPKKTEELVQKIARLGGSHKADILTTNMVHFNTSKHSNEQIYYNIVWLTEAIQQNKQASFVYFDRDEEGKPVPRKAGKKYIVDPVAFKINDDKYYLLAYSTKYDHTVHYRLDRMQQVQVLKSDCHPKVDEIRKQRSKNHSIVFDMYSGKSEKVTLQFTKDVMNSVHDRLGEHIKIKQVAEDIYETTADIQIAPTFYGWVFTFKGKMKIVGPEEVVQEYKKKLEKVVNAGHADHAEEKKS